MAYAEKITNSKDKVDQRLLNLHLVMQTNDLGHSFGFDNDVLINRKRKRKLYAETSSSSSSINTIKKNTLHNQ